MPLDHLAAIRSSSRPCIGRRRALKLVLSRSDARDPSVVRYAAASVSTTEELKDGLLDDTDVNAGHRGSFGLLAPGRVLCWRPDNVVGVRLSYERLLDSARGPL